MAAFIWKKAAPGDYYLWEEVPGQSKPVNVGRVRRKFPRGGYLARFYSGPHRLEFDKLTTPGRAIELLEAAIMLVSPDATFTRDNF